MIVEFGGESLSLAAWSRRVGISETTLRNRIAQRKWTVARALFTPVMSKSQAGTSSRKNSPWAKTMMIR